MEAIPGSQGEKRKKEQKTNSWDEFLRGTFPNVSPLHHKGRKEQTFDVRAYMYVLCSVAFLQPHLPTFSSNSQGERQNASFDMSLMKRVKNIFSNLSLRVIMYAELVYPFGIYLTDRSKSVLVLRDAVSPKYEYTYILDILPPLTSWLCGMAILSFFLSFFSLSFQAC